MMFMIPIPPTRSEIEAMPARSSVSTSLTELTVPRSWSWVLVALPESRRDLRRDGVYPGLGGSTDSDGGGVGVAADEQLTRSRNGNEHPIVRVGRPALRLKDADQVERETADVDRRTDRVVRQTQVVGRGGADDGDSHVLFHGQGREEGADPDVVSENVGVAVRRSGHGCGLVLKARGHKLVRADLWGHGGDAVELGDGVRVCQRERGRRTEGTAIGSGRRAEAGVYGQQVGAEVSELIADSLGSSLGDTDERHDGGDADDHAQHREHRS
jgi:hypothetical protein